MPNEQNKVKKSIIPLKKRLAKKMILRGMNYISVHGQRDIFACVPE